MNVCDSAFPYRLTNAFGDEVYDSGMSLRDWFAGQALTGIVGRMLSGDAADRSYQHADEMLADPMFAARDGNPGTPA